MQLADGGQGDVPVDENKLHGKPDKTLRFSLCSDNLEGISEGEGLLQSLRSFVLLFFHKCKGTCVTYSLSACPLPPGRLCCVTLRAMQGKEPAAEF